MLRDDGIRMMYEGGKLRGGRRSEGEGGEG